MLVNATCWAALVTTSFTADALPNVSGRVESSRPAVATIVSSPDARTLSLLISLAEPGRLPPGATVSATVALGTTTLSKTLHLGDPDVVWTIHQPAHTTGKITLKTERALPGSIPYSIRVTDVGVTSDDGVAFEAEPNDTPETANRLQLGQTIYGLADDRPYLPLGEESTDAEREAGKDWFRFEFISSTPQLCYFALDYADRDVPPDVRIYQLKDGQPVEYTTGIDPQSQQRERPPRLGANKFTTRVLSAGTYYVLVDACQPEYQLRTKLLPVPPYLKQEDADKPEAITSAARLAIRAAMDFQLLAGDSWHANTPRKGHPLDRVANFHHETSTCIACHPTHFATQSALEAVRNGYKVEQPFALRFLTERLYNNPVPFHGYREALWARMIPAPANVLGRLSTMTMDFENLVAGAPRTNTHRGIGEFLKLYYDGRTAIPADETNGNNPVSCYKVAADAWRQLDELYRRTGDDRYAQTRDLVARLIPEGEPANMRGLAQQTIGMCFAGRDRFKDEIQANMKRILDLQRPDGQWTIQFEANAQPAQMQTGECLYALALAGLPSDHLAMRKGAVALLEEQKPFGGWFDLNPYEQFRTPFRETQWSLMALARLYPGPGTKGWNGPLGHQPSSLRTDSPSQLIADLERIWDVPSPDLLASVVEQLGHESPLVRYTACGALSRVGGTEEIDALCARLGDETKLVRRAAAEAVRSIGNRSNGNLGPSETAAQLQYIAALGRALQSPDDRTRRGATRVFAAHFRELSQERELAEDLLDRLDDADPVVRMQAIKGLWRWWYWRSDPALRERIEDVLIARLDRPEHPWVRRNLIEALYIIGDENIRYLYNNWVPALANQERRDRATAGQHATVNRLGSKYVAVLASGSRLQREGVLRAMSEFFERPVLGGRIGNDLEPMLVYDDAVPRLAHALVTQMSDDNPTIRRLALQALVTVRGNRDQSLARSILRRRGDPDPSVREWAETMAKQFPLEIKRGRSDPALLAVVDELLANPISEAQAAALAVLGQLGPVAGADRSEVIRDHLKAEDAAPRAAALRALAAFPDLLADRAIRDPIHAALADDHPEVRVVAVRLALDHPALTSELALRKALEDETPGHRIALLSSIGASKADAADLRCVGVVSNALVDENAGVREKALQVVQAQPELIANAAIEESLRELGRSDNARQKEIAASLLKSRGKRSAGDGGADLLDLSYFEAKVLPIFNALGDDGQNCMGCHRSHTILKMVPPDKSGRWSPLGVRANFRATLRVVNLAKPTDSLLLHKPTWEAAEEAEAQTDPTRKAHVGGVRFDAETSPEYQTILDWLNGARLDAKGEHAEAP